MKKVGRAFPRCVWRLPLIGAIAAIGALPIAAQTPPTKAQLADEIHRMEPLLAQLPDRAPVLSQLAHDYAALGQMPKALALAKEYVSLHEGYTPEGDPAFAAVRESSDFKALVEEVHRDFPPVHKARTAFVVAQPDLIPEGLAVDANSQTFYLSSLNHRKIVQVSRAGTTSEFVPSGKYHLQPICGMKVDPANRDLWANTCPGDGRGAELLRFNDAGRLLGRFHVSTPEPHLLNDLVLADRRNLFLTDSLANKVFRFDRPAKRFTALSFSRPLYYPNGLALSGDGRTLYVADAFGILRYELSSRKASEVTTGIPVTIAGFDGLYWYKGSLVGIQNSLGLPRVVQLRLSPDGARVTAMRVLEYRTEFVQSPTTGAIVGSRFYFISNTQLENWLNGKVLDPGKLAPVRVAFMELEEWPEQRAQQE